MLVRDAQLIAKKLLAPHLPRRWKHVCAVAKKAQTIASILDDTQRETLVSAAWLHDIGYSPDVVETGQHSIDGARWLRRNGYDLSLASLVAYHSCALFEAQERGLSEKLRDEFKDESSLLRDALWYCDMTTGPDGQNLTVEQRLADIRERYGPEDLVSRFWLKAEGSLREAVREVDIRLGEVGIHPIYGSDR